MSFLSKLAIEQYFPPGFKLTLLLLLTLGASILLGVVATIEPILAVVAAVTMLLIYTVLTRPDAPTLAVLFIIYSNAAVVAVQFHQVPLVVGASVPILLVIPLTHYLILKRQKVVFTPVIVLLLLFLAIQLTGASFAIHTRIAFSNVGNFLTEGLLLYFLIINVVRTSQMLQGAIWTLLLAGALMGGLSFYQQITNTYDNNYGGFAQVSNAAFRTGESELLGEVEQKRLAGPIGEQNRYAQTLLMLVPLGLFQVWTKQPFWRRVLSAVLTGFIALGVALTFSRGAAVGFALMIVAMFLLGYIKFYQLLIVGAGLFLVLQAVPQFGARLTSLEFLSSLSSAEDEAGIAEADGSTQSRLTEMGAAALAFVDHPLVGVGPGMFRYHYQTYAEQIGLRVHDSNRQAHNLYLGLAAEAGAAGMLCFAAIIFVTFRELARIRQRWQRSRPEVAYMAMAFMLAVASYLTTGLFLHMAYIRFFWVIMGLAGAIAVITQNETKLREHRLHL